MKVESQAAIEADGLPVPQRYLSMTVILLGIAMSVLDGQLVNLALPSMVRDLHATPAAGVWVVTAYQVAALVLLLPFARLGEIVDQRRVYLCGLVLFVVASAGCAYASSLPVLIVARALQGVGSAGIMAVNASLVRATYPSRLLGRGLALNSVVVAASSVAGPTIAAAILSVSSWPWLFAVNLPIGVVVFVLGSRYLPRRSARNRANGAPLTPLDVVLNVLMFGLIFIGADAVGARAVNGESTIGATAGVVILVAGVLVATIYVARQRKLATPLLPLDLLRIPVFALSLCTSVGAFAAQTLGFVALPFLLLETYGRSHASAGLLMTAWPLATVVAAILTGRLIGRIADGMLGAIGLALMSCGLFLLSLLTVHSSDLDIAWRMALCGAGFGLFQSPNNHTIITSAPRGRSGAASGMLGTGRLTGQTLGTLLIGGVFGAVGATSGRGSELALLFAGGMAAIGAVSSGLRLKTT
jgi:DHA2 family multidrug resistance protein-like MFS transporter